jgi:hypothetical protein
MLRFRFLLAGFAITAVAASAIIDPAFADVSGTPSASIQRFVVGLAPVGMY